MSSEQSKTEQEIVDELVKIDKEATKNLETIDTLRNSVPLSLQEGDTEKPKVEEALQDIDSDLEKTKLLLTELIGMCNSTKKTQDFLNEVQAKRLEANAGFQVFNDRIYDFFRLFPSVPDLKS